MWEQILAIFLLWILSLIFARGFLYGLKFYQLNNSAYKKRVKGQTLKEWFLYSRFRDVIPKGLLVFYFLIMWIHLIAILLCAVLYCFDISHKKVVLKCFI